MCLHRLGNLKRLARLKASTANLHRKPVPPTPTSSSQVGPQARGVTDRSGARSKPQAVWTLETGTHPSRGAEGSEPIPNGLISGQPYPSGARALVLASSTTHCGTVAPLSVVRRVRVGASHAVGWCRPKGRGESYSAGNSKTSTSSDWPRTAMRPRG